MSFHQLVYDASHPIEGASAQTPAIKSNLDVVGEADLFYAIGRVIGLAQVQISYESSAFVDK